MPVIVIVIVVVLMMVMMMMMMLMMMLVGLRFVAFVFSAVVWACFAGVLLL